MDSKYDYALEELVGAEVHRRLLQAEEAKRREREFQQRVFPYLAPDYKPCTDPRQGKILEKAFSHLWPEGQGEDNEGR